MEVMVKHVESMEEIKKIPLISRFEMYIHGTTRTN